MGRITGFKSSTTGLDVGIDLVEKSYLIDRYPELADTFKQAGLWLWGDNNGFIAIGTLGDNTIVSKSSPIQTIAGGTNWKQVSAGYAVAAIKTDGTLWTWGTGRFGTLGDNTSVSNRSSPVQTVAGGTNWKQVTCGSARQAAIKTDGTLWGWGSGTFGSNGDGTTTTRSSPVQTVAGGTNWKKLATQMFHGTMAIKTDGSLWVWGSNSIGLLGDGTTTGRSSPVQTVAGRERRGNVAGTDSRGV
jgi:alpha-tubulin suppressor-like RCC1 family protein